MSTRVHCIEYRTQSIDSMIYNNKTQNYFNESSIYFLIRIVSHDSFVGYLIVGRIDAGNSLPKRIFWGTGDRRQTTIGKVPLFI